MVKSFVFETKMASKNKFLAKWTFTLVGIFLKLEAFLFLQMYTQFVNGYDKAMSVFQDTMKDNSEFANLVSEFQVRDV